MSQHIEQIRYNMPSVSQVKSNSNQFKEEEREGERKRKARMVIAPYNKELNFMLLSV